MSSGTLEAIAWCPQCEVEKFRVYRVATESETVFVNETEPENPAKTCEVCGTVIERMP